MTWVKKTGGRLKRERWRDGEKSGDGQTERTKAGRTCHGRAARGEPEDAETSREFTVAGRGERGNCTVTLRGRGVASETSDPLCERF